ncbi:hypothetical protein AXG93_3506s1140 [Marchantia polymorpha subsp. ruderalis]|uniref:Uncharacterized protein n=1 Tax=Marchantia polymorpha subsp. ruderalis TaxID=1480154 RepID=A0A176VKL5_MARPO|nr:hypothetical protein AXG93_3506s1140 [Marchantia polymorpha subsp. ruderalis]
MAIRSLGDRGKDCDLSATQYAETEALGALVPKAGTVISKQHTREVANHKSNSISARYTPPEEKEIGASKYEAITKFSENNG